MGATRRREGSWREREEEIQVSTLKGVASLRDVLDTKLEHESYPKRQIAVCLCVYCVNLAQMRHGREYCLHNKQGHVQFNFHNAKQSPAEHVDMRKTLPGRQAATMFLFCSGPNDAAMAVKHSSTQSDNNELSPADARNFCCKTKVLDCVLELRADYLARCTDAAR